MRVHAQSATKTRECSGHNEAAIRLPRVDRCGSAALSTRRVASGLSGFVDLEQYKLMLLGDATSGFPLVVLPPINANRAVAACRRALRMQSACTLTADECAPTCTVVSPVARFVVPWSSISADRSPNHVTCETADSLLH